MVLKSPDNKEKRANKTTKDKQKIICKKPLYLKGFLNAKNGLALEQKKVFPYI